MKANFITSSSGNFCLNEKPFRFIGCNMYELAYVDSRTLELMFKEAVNEGFNVIRFWAFEPADKDKLKEIFELAGEHHIKVIPVLADMHDYLQNYKIDSNWYREGYKKNYLVHAKSIVSSFCDREEVLLWEMINEPAADSFADIYNFIKVASERIKEIDSNHLISVGTVGGIGDRFGGFFSRFNSDNFRKLNSIKTIDAVSMHDYSFSSTVLERLDIFQRLKGNAKRSRMFNAFDRFINKIPIAIDKATLRNYGMTFDFPLTIRSLWKKYNSKNIFIARSLNKPIYIGEIGFKKNLNGFRKILLESELKRYYNEGVCGILLWSFESQGKSLDGHDYGFDANDRWGEVVRKMNLNLATLFKHD